MWLHIIQSWSAGDIPERMAVMSSNINRLLDEKRRMVGEIVTSHKRPSAHRRGDVVILENQVTKQNGDRSWMT